MNDFKNWMILNGKADTTANNYSIYVDKIISSLGELTEEKINNYVVELRNNKANASTINFQINALRAFLKFKNSDIKLPRLFGLQRKIPNYLRKEEMESLSLNLADIFPRKALIKNRALLHSMFYLGLRKSEFLNIKRSDFDFSRKELKVYCQKTQEEKICLLCPKIIEILKDYFKHEPEKYNAFNLKPNTINYMFERVKKVADKHITPHCLRSSYAVNLLRNNFSLVEVQRALSHRSLQSTLHYAFADVEDMREKMELLK